MHGGPIMPFRRTGDEKKEAVALRQNSSEAGN